MSTVPLPHDVAPRVAERSLLGRLSSQNRCVGIDIGTREIRVARLEHVPGTSLHRWRTSLRFPVENRELSPEWLEEVPEVIAASLPLCIDGSPPVSAISLPVEWTHYQTITGSERREIQRRTDQMFAASAFQSEAHLCQWPVVGVHHGRPSREDQYIVAAISKRLVCQVVDAVGKAGYKVVSVLPQSVALAHAASELTGIDAQLIVWLDREGSLVTVRHQSGVGLTRALPDIPDAILELESDDRPLDRFALRPYLADVGNELTSTMRYAARVDMSRPSERPILLAGPLAEVSGVEDIVAQVANSPVAVWRYQGKDRPKLTTREAELPDDALQRIDSRYATALSLAFAASRCGKRGYAE